MKKLIAILAASTLITSAFVSCGDADDESSGTSGASTSASASTDEDSETTEASTEEDTTEEKTTEKKTTESEKATTTEDVEEKTTTAKTTTGSKKTDITVPGHSTGSIVGKWNIPQELMDEMDIDISDIPSGMEMGDMYIEFTDNSEMNIYVSFDMSGLMYLTDDSFYMAGMSFNELNYDGSVLKVTAMEKDVMTLERIDAPDKSTMYGKYKPTSSLGSSSNDAEYAFNFPESGKALMEVYKTTNYNFDESTGKLTSEEGDQIVDVEISGDTMKWTTEDGKKVSFERIE